MPPTPCELEPVDDPSPSKISASHALSMGDDDFFRFVRLHQAFDESSIGDLAQCPADQRDRLRSRIDHFNREQPITPCTSAGSGPHNVETADSEQPRVAHSDRSTKAAPQSHHLLRGWQPSLRNPYAPSRTETFDEYTLRVQRYAYHRLVNAGGRPAFPLSLLPTVVTFPENHQGMLLPWEHVTLSNGLPEPEISVFSQQLTRWTLFREWQRVCRGQVQEFEDYLQSLKDNQEYRHRTDFQQPPGVVEPESNDQLGEWTKGWERGRSVREERVRKEQYANMQTFNLEMKRRMSDIGFPLSFQFDKDPTAQNTLTTWIEYLCFEDDKRREIVAQLEVNRRLYEGAWEKLVATNLLPAHIARDDTQQITKQHSAAIASLDHLREICDHSRDAYSRLLDQTREEVEDESVPEHNQELVRQAKAKMEVSERDWKAQDKMSLAFSTYERQRKDFLSSSSRLERQEMLVKWVRSQTLEILKEMEAATGNAAHSTPGQVSQPVKGLPLSAWVTSLRRAAFFPSPQWYTILTPLPWMDDLRRLDWRAAWNVGRDLAKAAQYGRTDEVKAKYRAMVEDARKTRPELFSNTPSPQHNQQDEAAEFAPLPPALDDDADADADGNATETSVAEPDPVVSAQDGGNQTSPTMAGTQEPQQQVKRKAHDDETAAGLRPAARSSKARRRK